MAVTDTWCRCTTIHRSAVSRSPALARFSTEPVERAATAATPSCQVVYDNRPIVQVTGAIGPRAACGVGEVIRTLHVGGARHVVVDLSSAAACHVHLLAVLARSRADLSDDTGTLQLTGVRLREFSAALDSASPDEAFVLYDAVR